MTKILGLDLGTNSIGWAITEQNEDTFTLLDKGVDIFQEGVARTKSGEEPMVKTRTDARALRRHYYRRRLRKIELLKVLVEHNLCPYLSKEHLDEWRYNKNYPLIEEFLLWLRSGSGDDQNPYADRYVALTKTLDLNTQTDRYTLGRALYHLVQRRGFLSNRKETESGEDGKVKGAIGKLDKDMEEAGCTYLGEFYYKLFLAGEKIRTGDGYGYAGRIAHYEKEFNAICEKQNLSAELRKALHRAIFFQRPLKSQKGLVGGCTFEKGKARCPISHPLFEEFRMWSFVNNIKIKTPDDAELRMLSAEEVEQIKPLFLRKSKDHFDFEDIAKKLSGSKKNSYAHITDKVDAPYKFNFKMSQNVSGSPVTAHLKDIFGEEWLTTMCSLYAEGEGKTPSQILNDVWHVLFSFDNDDKLGNWAVENLQLSEEQVKAFLKIPIKQGYASLSLNAINKILPYLRAGYRYDEAVFVANLEKVVPANVWANETKRGQIIDNVVDAVANFQPSRSGETKEDAIYSALLECGLYGDELRMNNLYHPSKVESYKDAQPNADGLVLLGSPRTSSVRNPMAMRALFRLRVLVNQLLKEGKIDKQTKINIEFARGLNDSNKRSAIERYQRENEKKRQEYADEIKALFKAECGCDITPTEDDILKYQLWIEQNKQCLYTGEQIGICDFIGPNPKYDIEHTVPRSRGGDNSQMNKTLCQAKFNRDIKREMLPSELANHKEIVARIEPLGWQAEIEKLEKQIFGCNRSAKSAATKETKDKAIKDRHYYRMRLDYLRGKLMRFSMTEVPEGFSNRQGVDIGIIGRYAKMYLETVFDRVYTVKGATTADFRKMWGLQEVYTKKERVNHIHHCIDAITIACIGAGTYAKWAQFQNDTERYSWHRDQKPVFDKPWDTFTEDVKAIADELLVSHHTADNLPKHTKKKLRVRGEIQYNENGEIKYIQGDTARGSLHQQTFYGAIKRDDEIKYVVRKALSSLQPADVDKIVDDAVRECVKRAIAEKGFKEAMSEPICFNEEKGVYIKKVRIYTPSVTSPIHLKKHSHLSRHEHKQDYHVANDGNYCMAIYEGEVKGKIKRGFELVNNLDAALFYNGKSDNDSLVPQVKDGLPLKCILRTGTMVLFYEKSPEEFYECTKEDLVKRLYKVTGMSKQVISGIYHYGLTTLKHHQEARPAGELKEKKGLWEMGEEYRPVIIINHNQFNALVEGYDFDLTVTGEIKFKHKF
ncbi:MAG: CRISPR-associated protein Csn1 [Tidjanibacter sp.]|nr:CRISPR-associated protein Csn1 [Tidjanibacter sp.]